MKATFLLTAIVGLAVVLGSQASAENEQWLQYSWSADAQQMLGGIGLGSFNVSLANKLPAELSLPEFKGKEPLFAFWRHSMTKAGGAWIALDSTNKYGDYDRLYIDSDGDGSLKDETAITSNRQDDVYTWFGPVKVIFEGEDGPITYHLNIQFYNYDNTNRFMYIRSACWYEGTITAGGVKKKCILIDNNVNGTFNDKGMNTSQCDRIVIGEKASINSTSVGNLLQIDDQLYKCEIARDGAFIKLAKADDVKFGDVNIPKAITSLSVCGENGFFSVPIENGSGKLPAGKYLINNWQIERKDASNNKWQMTGSGFGTNSAFTVSETGKVNLDIGEPVSSSLAVNKQDSQYVFNLTMSGRGGESVMLTFNNSQPREPKLSFLSKDGKYNRAFALRYG